MTGQKKPPRTREEQIIHLGAHIFVGQKNLTDANCRAARNIDEAEARGRAEALAELRAGAADEQEIEQAKDEGANFVLKSLAAVFGRGGFDVMDGSETWDGDVHATLIRLLDDCGVTFEGDPVPREAELAAEVERLTKTLFAAHDALTRTAWQNCSNTHCERKQECREPSECGGTGKPRAIRILCAALAAAPETRG